MVNSPDGIGGKTQLLENISFYDNALETNKPCHSLWDGGSTSSFLHEETAIERNLPRRRISPQGVRTLQGRSESKWIYLVTLPNTKGLH